MNIFKKTENLSFYILGLCLFISSCSKNEENQNALSFSQEEDLLKELIKLTSPDQNLSYYTFPDSNDLDKIPQDVQNPLSTAKVELGKMLFHDPRLGRKNLLPIGQETYSCASCHLANRGFRAGVKQGLGEGGLGFGLNGESRVPNPAFNFKDIDAQPLRTLASLNNAYQELALWSGKLGAAKDNLNHVDKWEEGTPPGLNYKGYTGIETQAIAGSGIHRLDMSEQIAEECGYTELFEKAFPGKARKFTVENMALAIAAYERTILANQSPFQKWLKGDQNALDIKMIKGAQLFFSKGNCTVCHDQPAFASDNFYALGFNDFKQNETVSTQEAIDKTGLGRMEFTNQEVDKYRFRVPQLYNLKDNDFWGHGASFSNLRELVQYKNTAISQNPNVTSKYLSNVFIPLNFTEEEIDQLTYFLEDGLYDPSLQRYVPSSIPGDGCLINADEISKVDLNCQ